MPRRTTRIVLCDDGDGLAHRAATKLMHFGYRDLSVLDGGIAAWKAAGYELFSGVHVPSKAFGELVEHDDGTPHISAAELKAKLDRGEDVVILDSRPMNEYRRMNIPGGIDCPGAELVHRFFETRQVARDAGRRQLRRAHAQHHRRAVADQCRRAEPRAWRCKDGTMGWHARRASTLEARADAACAARLGAQARAKAREAARRGSQRARRERASIAQRWRGSQAERGPQPLSASTCAAPEEYAAGHLPGTRSAPGGQLVQATDQYVGTRNARHRAGRRRRRARRA